MSRLDQHIADGDSESDSRWGSRGGGGRRGGDSESQEGGGGGQEGGGGGQCGQRHPVSKLGLRGWRGFIDDGCRGGGVGRGDRRWVGRVAVVPPRQRATGGAKGEEEECCVEEESDELTGVRRQRRGRGRKKLDAGSPWSRRRRRRPRGRTVPLSRHAIGVLPKARAFPMIIHLDTKNHLSFPVLQ
jgi:hypothetical protein